MRVLYHLISLAFIVLGVVLGQEDAQTERRQVTVRTVFAPPHCQSPDVRRSKMGDRVLVHFTGVYLNSTGEVAEGQVFDTTRDSGQPYNFQLGSTGLMHGWEEAVVGMCVGEKRVAVIPHLYGWEDHVHKDTLQLVSGRGVPIPSGTDLEFEIELQAFSDPPSKNANFFREMDSNFDNFVDRKEMERWFKAKHPRGMGSVPPGLWERQDTDNDGLISWDEFRGPKGERVEGEDL